MSRIPFTVVALAALFASSSALSAQPANSPTLNQILQRLESNLHHLDADLPSLFCDEHVLSSQTEPRTRDENTVIDSVFRLRRTPAPGQATALVESREIRTVDGKPATSQQMDGPALLSGLFEGGLAIVSLNQAPCMTYTLQPPSRKRPAAPYVVHFATARHPQNPADCFLQEKSRGRVLIDPASLQITRLEITTPRHTIIAGDDFTAPVIGKRDLTVDYAPVRLGDATFWLPSVIAMRAASNGFRIIVWSYQATYRNYHRLEVTSRILAGSETPSR